MDTYTFEETRFMVGAEEKSDEQLLITIPHRYKEWFSGAKFKDMHHLSMALMYAHCADEAWDYKKSHLIDQHERALRSSLKL